MKYPLLSVVTAVLVLSLSVASSRAEVKVVWERNEGAAATAQFRFGSVPSPSKTDAAANARFSIVAGEGDSNGGGLNVLHDGSLPIDADQPDANFFFAAGTAGGRLVVDLGQATEVKQVNTYSWHPDTRGPQVYTLYASDGLDKAFEARPGKRVAPEKAGWKQIAKVDTRPKQGPPGGQYGVSISDPATGILGKYRYLLFDISQTESADPFGNTFFSEIDVNDGKEHAAAATAAATASITTASVASGKYEIVFDTSEMPELKEWVDTKLRPVCEKWYPILVETLPSEGYQAPKRFTVTFRKDKRGVADTGGTRINCAGDWFKQNLEGEAIGAVVHEMVHVVQQYGRTRGASRNPGWLVEGVADYLRWFQFEAPSKRPRPNPARAKYTDSYRTTAAFLNYIIEKHDKDIVKKFNAAMRAGKYAPELWKTYTGKTVDELWADYVKTLERK